MKNPAPRPDSDLNAIVLCNTDKGHMFHRHACGTQRDNKRNPIVQDYDDPCNFLQIAFPTIDDYKIKNVLFG